MCGFCKYVFDMDLLNGRFRGNKKELQEQERKKLREYQAHNEYGGDFLYVERIRGEVMYGILAETGDCFQEGFVQGIRYCPMCGRGLNATY